jgi:hypothetical protein
VKVVRLSIATAAVSALLAIGALVALAAPGAVTRAATAQGGAGLAVYCPNKQARQDQLNAFIRTKVAAAKKFFASHPSATDRKAFLQAQASQLAALRRALAKCG